MLGLASYVYLKFVNARNRRFDDGRSAAHELGGRTVSIGNITTGGTGKTPLVIKTAELLAGRGKRVCVLTRGYGRRNAKSRVLVSDGRSILADAATAGDEPLEMAMRLTGKAIVISDPNRVDAAKWATETYGANAFVLDDAFQHRHAKRDVDIACIDALNPFGGGRLLPAGRLREPLENLRRATAIVVTRANLVETQIVSDIKFQIAAAAPGVPVYTATTKMKALTELSSFIGGDKAAPTDYSSIANRKAFAFCGLGNPRAFFEQLRRDNFELSGEATFADHYCYSKKDVAKLEKMAAQSGGSFLLTTAKDAVRLAGLNVEMPCFVVEVAVTLNDENAFAAMI